VSIVTVAAAGRQCGFPGRPRNGTSATGAPVSRPGDTAHYTCRPGYTLFGEEERVCLDSGIWAGRQPLCGECKVHYTSRCFMGRWCSLVLKFQHPCAEHLMDFNKICYKCSASKVIRLITFWLTLSHYKPYLTLLFTRISVSRNFLDAHIWIMKNA
jgi:hypothetical protein